MLIEHLGRLFAIPPNAIPCVVPVLIVEDRGNSVNVVNESFLDARCSCVKGPEAVSLNFPPVSHGLEMLQMLIRNAVRDGRTCSMEVFKERREL
jgi:hypothetical protein